MNSANIKGKAELQLACLRWVLSLNETYSRSGWLYLSSVQAASSPCWYACSSMWGTQLLWCWCGLLTQLEEAFALRKLRAYNLWAKILFFVFFSLVDFLLDLGSKIGYPGKTMVSEKRGWVSSNLFKDGEISSLHLASNWLITIRNLIDWSPRLNETKWDQRKQIYYQIVINYTEGIWNNLGGGSLVHWSLGSLCF